MEGCHFSSSPDAFGGRAEGGSRFSRLRWSFSGSPSRGMALDDGTRAPRSRAVPAVTRLAAFGYMV